MRAIWHKHGRGFVWLPLFDLLHSNAAGFQQLHLFANASHKEQAQSLVTLLKDWLAPQCSVTLNILKNPDDVHAVHSHIAQVCDSLAQQHLDERHILLDVHGASQTYTIAAGMASLSCGTHLARTNQSGRLCAHHWIHSSDA